MVFSSLFLFSRRADASDEVAVKWSKCGGEEWNGPTECVPGFECVEHSKWFSQCLPAGQPVGAPVVLPAEPVEAPVTAPVDSVPVPAPADSPVEGAESTGAKVPKYGQCGGNGYDGPFECEDGLACVETVPSLWSMCMDSRRREGNPLNGAPSVIASLFTNPAGLSGDASFMIPQSLVSSKHKGGASGACSYTNVYDQKTGDRLSAFGVDAFVAVRPELYHGSLACGMCLEYKSNGAGIGTRVGSGIAMVVDKCPSCYEGDLDFERDGSGKWPVTWKAVDCPVKQDSNPKNQFEYAITDSNAYSLKLQIRNTKVPIAQVQLLHNGDYHPMLRKEDNFFYANSVTPALLPPYYSPLSLKITSIFGEIVTETNLITDAFESLSMAKPVTGTVQFVHASLLERRLAGIH